jgi:acid stress chaperone HdeB
MTTLIAVGIAFMSFILAAAGPASAQVALDVAKIDCGQFLSYKVANPKNIAIWLNGYHHGRSGDTVVDMQQLDEDVDKIQKYCAANPATPLMQAVETVIGPRN